MCVFKFLNSVEISGNNMRENVSGYLHPSNFSRLSWAKLTWSSMGSSLTLSGRWPPEVLSGQHFHDPVLRSGYKENQVLSLPSQLEMLTAAPCLGVFFPSVQRFAAIAFSLANTRPTFPFISAPLYSAGVSLQMVTYFYRMFHRYWVICFPFPLCASDSVGPSF